MSVQITVVLPSVSTAGSLRMIARRRAMRETPMASVTVTATGNPSGMAPTASAMADERIASRLSPRHRPRARTSPARPEIRMSSLCPKILIWRVSGVSRLCAAEIISEMRPISV